ncbi:hypothetical protein HMPREF0391_10928 [Finegoldia magna ATCC 53516]|uniref:Uncharacterized protein n=1 Tax=Finegoldia magna ATCC 53516 TaxID=525282 RepID=D6S8Z2_FINMA|nr:hypothetical protein HMPREF0391_10928 [Finegoldia magna ATCC 53516]
MECKYYKDKLKKEKDEIKIYPEWNVNENSEFTFNRLNGIKIYPEWNVNYQCFENSTNDG